MNKMRFQITCFAIVLLALLAAFPAAAQCNNGREGVLSDTFLGASAVEWRMLVEHRAVTLTVSAPCGLVIDRTYEEGKSPFFSLKEIPADPDGVYTWQLRVAPHVDPEVEKALKSARESGEDRTIEYELRQKGALPKGPFLQTGSFTVVNGAIVPQDEEERQSSKLTAGVRPAASADDCPFEKAAPAVQTARLGSIAPAVDRGGSARPPALAAAETPRRMAAPDVVYNDDLIIIGSLCVGFDCVNGEVFSFDTIRLKENNLRIKFEDTSGGSFPSRDWEIEINSSTNGGQSHFRINDVTGARSPFTIEAAAPSHSLYVDSSGRIGRKTANPVLELHIADGDTPGIRLEQDTSSGFGAQTWDIAGNETSFFVRDATNGSTLPFRIFPGSSSSALVVRDGKIGMGVTSPQQTLHINGAGTTDSSKIFFQSDPLSTTTGHTFGVRSDTQNVDLQVEALRNFTVIIDDDSNDASSANFLISIDGNPNNDIFRVREDKRIRMNGASPTATTHPLVVGTDATDGNGAFLTAAGIWTNGSSRTNKTAIRPLDPMDAHEALAKLQPVRYRGLQEPSEEYVGFIAEDVPDLVAMNGRKGIASMDIVGVLTKVVQEQQEALAEQQEALTLLTNEVTELREKMKTMEAP